MMLYEGFKFGLLAGMVVTVLIAIIIGRDKKNKKGIVYPDQPNYRYKGKRKHSTKSRTHRKQ